MVTQADKIIADIEQYLDTHRRVIAGKLAELQLVLASQQASSSPSYKRAPPAKQKPKALSQPRPGPIPVDLHDLFAALPLDTPPSQWVTGADARAHVFNHLHVDEALWTDSYHSALWHRISTRLQEIWGRRVKYGTMRYPIVKRVTTV